MDTVVDNDLILKSVSYGLTEAFWPECNANSIGVLGAARYVVHHEIDRAGLNRGAAAAHSDLSGLLARCEELEPTKEEITLAAEIELAAIVVVRDLPLFETGDKRAISGLEEARRHLRALNALQGRVRCLEQIVRRAISVEERFDGFSSGVCAESGVDKSLSICFGCFGNSPADRTTVHEALTQYILEVRRSASNVLVNED